MIVLFYVICILTGTFIGSYFAVSIRVYEGKAYVATGFKLLRLYVFDISKPTDPVLLSKTTLAKEGK